MPNVLPGAVWQPIDVGNRAARRKGRGLIGHVAVSTASNLVPGPLSSRSADWHFYLPKAGPAIQYIDMDLQCWASQAGNASLVAFESEGGMGSSAQLNAEPWTDNQLDWAARILRYLHDTEGVPLAVMPDSRPSSRGFGTHRLGIDPWRVADGEVWSSSRGKECPGDTKHAQRFDIVNRAINGTPGGFLMALTDQQQADLLSWVGALYAVTISPTKGADGEVLDRLRAIHAAVADPTALATALRKELGDVAASGQPVSQEMLEAALRKVLGSLGTA